MGFFWIFIISPLLPKNIEIMKQFKTVKYLTFREINNDKECTYTKLQKHILKVSNKDALKDYKRGYYSTNICDWKNSNLIEKKGKFYRLTSLGKLYLRNPKEANLKVRIYKLEKSVKRFQGIAKHWYNESKANHQSKEVEELRDENYRLSYKLDQIRKTVLNYNI